MNRVILVVVWAACAVACGCAAPAPSSSPARSEVETVLAYVRAHPPETLESDGIPPRIRDAVALDIDRDGTVEVFVWTAPRFAQSPTISIYTIERDGNVRPLAQALAPGPVRRSTGARWDGHTLRIAVDATLEEGDGKGFIEASRDAALEQGTLLVAYPNFVHLEARGGSGTFLDMTDQAVTADSCANLEVAEITAISAGTLRGRGDAPRFLALVDDSIYAYRIDEIREPGVFENELLVLDKPADFVAFASPDAGEVTYQSTSGDTMPLR